MPMKYHTFVESCNARYVPGSDSIRAVRCGRLAVTGI